MNQFLRYPVLLLLLCTTIFAGDEPKEKPKTPSDKKDPVAEKKDPLDSLTGNWLGKLKVEGLELRLGFEIEKKGDTYKAYLYSIEQGARKMPTTKVDWQDPKVTIDVSDVKISYSGTLDHKTKKIVGKFKQSGRELDLDLERVAEMPYMKRSQTPKEPFPYAIEEVKFPSKAEKITMAGTITIPEGKGPFPGVILISGSGAQDRNCTILGHQSFWVIADYLSRRGVAVLRYDDRGVGQSTGTHATANSKDFAQDALGAFEYFKKHPKISQVGFAGHSEGGLIAPMVAAEKPDVDFVIMLAGPGLPGDEVIQSQGTAISKLTGESEDYIKFEAQLGKLLHNHVKNNSKLEDINQSLTEFMNNLTNEQRKLFNLDEVKKSINQLRTPWMKFYISHDPRPTLEKIKCPVLVIQGERDCQVLPKENVAAIEKAFEKAGNKQVTVYMVPNANHLFQRCKTGSLNEYATIDETFAVPVMDKMLDWIKATTKTGK